jgi:hypothetical protein
LAIPSLFYSFGARPAFRVSEEPSAAADGALLLPSRLLLRWALLPKLESTFATFRRDGSVDTFRLDWF